HVGRTIDGAAGHTDAVAGMGNVHAFRTPRGRASLHDFSLPKSYAGARVHAEEVNRSIILCSRQCHDVKPARGLDWVVDRREIIPFGKGGGRPDGRAGP